MISSCGRDASDANVIQAKGFDFNEECIEMRHPFLLHTIDYANGHTHHYLSGDLFIADEIVDFHILFDQTMNDGRIPVKSFQTSIPELNNKDFDIILTREGDVFEITWRKEAQSFYLKNSVKP